MQKDVSARVVIVGAGFGGLWLARRLGKAPLRVLVLDRNNYHLFSPLLYQVAAAEIEASEVAYPVRSILSKNPNVRFQMTEVEALDPARRIVRTAGKEITYDILVLGLGSAPHFLGIPGAQEHSFPLKGLNDGLELRNRILSRFELAAVDSEPARRRRLLTFVIVGGGTTGVELAGALRELIRSLLKREYRELERECTGVVLVEALDRLLTEFPPPHGEYARERLERMGVSVRLNTKVAEITPRGVRLEDGGTIESDSVIWSAGVRGHPLVESAGLPTSPKGTVRVHPTLQVEDHPEIFAVGDVAYLEQGGEPLPMIAPVATQQARFLARNLVRHVRGEPLEEFRYRDPGRLATIGRNKAVAQIRGRSFTGFPAWALWAGVHLGKLIGFRNKLLVLVNWLDDYLFYQRAIRLIMPFHEVADVVDQNEPPAPAARSGEREPLEPTEGMERSLGR